MIHLQKIVLMLALIFLSNASFAQSVNYKQPMTINAKGQINDEKGTAIGLISKDQIVSDAGGKKIAFVDGQGNLVDAKTGKKMGHMGKDGKTYYSANGDLLFNVKDKPDNTCDIFDTKGTKIGNVHNSYKSTACALHCFQNQHTHMK